MFYNFWMETLIVVEYWVFLKQKRQWICQTMVAWGFFPINFRENSSGKSAQKQANFVANLNPYDMFLRL